MYSCFGSIELGLLFITEYLWIYSRKEKTRPNQKLKVDKEALLRLGTENNSYEDKDKNPHFSCSFLSLFFLLDVSYQALESQVSEGKKHWFGIAIKRKEQTFFFFLIFVPIHHDNLLLGNNHTTTVKTSNPSFCRVCVLFIYQFCGCGVPRSTFHVPSSKQTHIIYQNPFILIETMNSPKWKFRIDCCCLMYRAHPAKWCNIVAESV